MTVEPTIDLSFHTARVSQEHLGVVFGVNKRIYIKPDQRSRAAAFCRMPEGARLHAMMGHFHSHGYDYKVIERMPDQLLGQELYSAPDEPAFEFKVFSPPHDVARGAGFQYECNFFNRDGPTLTWGSNTRTQEHCNMTAYYSPAEEISDLCLTEPSKLSTLTPSEEAVRAGQDEAFDIGLAALEASDVTVALQSSDASALEVPPSVTIPAGQQHASFIAQAKRPGNFEVSASVDDARIAAAVRVTGLVLSEVFYDPLTGATSGLQWIEIANQADVPLDLSAYSIGAGTTDFMTTRLALSPIMISAHGCIVVGGPESAPANYSPILVPNTKLEPDLGLGAERAAGVGLFPALGMSSMARPVDAVVYGGVNTTLRGSDGQIAPVWPGSRPGGSIKRVSETVWATSTAPTPGLCEIPDAH
jgi:hypothetical protein